ncbi:MAG: ABC transporter ATP-binding protein [Deltaproteobacteria bacterium]|jgi:branched-chain amino acid transport system ATP-binding protein|nr:ABC transporter ATP-binding protein [Deltaproteobacteria bacterium]
MLEIRDIHVYRGQTYVLQGVSLEVGRGEIVALIGANGAGKTSMLRTISGLLRTKSGQIMYQPDANGEKIDISRMSAERIVNLGLCHCPEGRGIFSQLSVRENLLVGAYLNKDKQALADDYKNVCEIFPILGERSDQAGGSLSGGEQEMLAVGRALMSRPRLLILDEPSLGLGPIIVENLFAILRQINTQGVTILLVEQNAVMALEYADRAYVLENGRVTLSGPSRELAEDENVRRAYLGGL